MPLLKLFTQGYGKGRQVEVFHLNQLELGFTEGEPQVPEHFLELFRVPEVQKGPLIPILSVGLLRWYVTPTFDFLSTRVRDEFVPNVIPQNTEGLQLGRVQLLKVSLGHDHDVMLNSANLFTVPLDPTRDRVLFGTLHTLHEGILQIRFNGLQLKLLLLDSIILWRWRRALFIWWWGSIPKMNLLSC